MTMKKGTPKMENKFDVNDILAEKQQFGEVKVHEVYSVSDFDNAMDELADLDDADKQAQARFDAKVKPWKSSSTASSRRSKHGASFCSVRPMPTCSTTTMTTA